MTAPRTVSRADIEAKLREIKTEVDTGAEQARSYALMAGAAAVVAVAGLAFLLGRRKGRRQTTVVEIHRV